MDENYTDEFMDEDEDLYVEDENPDPEQEADMHKSIEPDSVDSVEVVRTAVIQENVQPQPMQNVPEPGEQAESDIDKLPYKGYITYLYNLLVMQTRDWDIWMRSGRRFARRLIPHCS